MERPEHSPDRALFEVSDPLRDATERLAEAAATGRPGALLSALLDALEGTSRVARATLWARAGAESTLLAGPTAWMQLRSRGATTPNPDGAGPRHGVLFGEALGALVYERETFDDGGREERESATEALFLCADVLAATDPACGHSGEVPAPFSMGDRDSKGDADDRAA